MGLAEHEQQLRQALVRSLEHRTADLVVRVIKLVAQSLSEPQADVAVVMQEAKELVTGDEAELGPLQRLGGEIVRPAGEQRPDPEDLPGADDTEDDSSAVRGDGRELDTTAADAVRPARLVAFQKHDRAARINVRLAQSIQFEQANLIQARENALRSGSATYTLGIRAVVVLCNSRIGRSFAVVKLS